MYSSPVTSNVFLSDSATAITLNSLASFLVLPVASAALDSIQIDSLVGAALNADATVRVFPLFDTAESVCVSVNVNGVHCTNTKLPLSSCNVAAASSVVMLVR